MTSQKRPASPTLIPNPFIKKQNLRWTLTSPPAPTTTTTTTTTTNNNEPDASPEADPRLPRPDPSGDVDHGSRPTTAAIESGVALVQDHLTRFSEHLTKVSRPISSDAPSPRLSIPSYAALYEANSGSKDGAHFVIHQHDHPVAGTHYDLRLQINENSSASWAIMYGLPGDPNSVRLNRNATETRIHSLWNHLVETASPDTGSLMIWDTGTYTILPRQSKHAPAHDPSSPQHSPQSPSSGSATNQQSLLHAAFQSRKVKLQLHGSKLPDPYIIYLRLTRSEDAAGRAKSARTDRPRKRRRRGRAAAAAPETSSSDSETEEEQGDADADVLPTAGEQIAANANVSADDRELRELENDETRRTNAYPGAENTIGSIHQRKWYLSLDRAACGFVERRKDGRAVWERRDRELEPSKGDAARLSYPFYVRGRDYEKSVVTGRLGQDILSDEGVVGFTPRMGWKPVVK